MNSSTFLNASPEYSQKPSIGASLIYTIGELLQKNDASSPILALNILHHCLHYSKLLLMKNIEMANYSANREFT